MKIKNFRKVLLHPGYLNPDEIIRIKRDHPQLKLIRHSTKGLKCFQEKKIDITTYPNHKNENFSTPLKNDIQKTWSGLIDDHQTSLIFGRTKKYDSEVIKFNEIIVMCYTYQKWLETEKPDLLIFTSTPHNIKNWILAKVAEAIDIPVVFFQASFFPWRQFLLQGIKKNANIIQPITKETSEKEKNFYSDYIMKKMGGIEEAMPAYEIKRLRENNWKPIALKKEIGNFFKNPFSSIEKIKSYASYTRLSREIKDIKYIAFFLHYQPERTSIPEGYGFGVQLAAIISLQQALPENTYLVVKEHPSTYTYNFSKKYKNKDFYELISSIDRVIISEITADPYKLIDGSIATASITGTVIGEAFVRGKPCIAFGAGPMQAVNSPSFHRYETIEALRDFLRKQEKPDVCATEKYFQNVCNSTFSGIGAEDTHYNEKSRSNYLSNSIITGIEQLLNGELYINHSPTQL